MQRLRASQPYLLTSSSVYELYSLICWRPAAPTNVTTLFIDVQQRLRTSWQPVILTNIYAIALFNDLSDVYERHILIYWPPVSSKNFIAFYIDLQQRLRTSQPHHWPPVGLANVTACQLTSSSVLGYQSLQLWHLAVFLSNVGFSILCSNMFYPINSKLLVWSSRNNSALNGVLVQNEGTQML